jgi:uncharacterized protein YjiS (DUF1127 family)
MTRHMPMRSVPLGRGRLASGTWARIDPVVYASEARRLHARAVAETLSAGWRGFRRMLVGLVGWTERHLVRPLAKRSERRQAIAQLAALDARLLSDIGLRRSDIELAVDGLLANPRVARRTQAPAVSTEPDHMLDRAA